MLPDSRALSLKERLQKWREEKQKLLEQKKKQPPAFVVKTVEHKSDFHLYRGPSKNSKVMAEVAHKSDQQKERLIVCLSRF